MAWLSAEHTQIFFETMLALLGSELAISAEFQHIVRFGSGPVLRPLMVIVGLATRSGRGGLGRMGGSGLVEDIHGGAGFHVATYLGLALPIVHIEGLREGSQFSKCGRFPNPRNVVLDALWQSIIE